ncbi:hypothetical protein PYCCODRAFT_165309 [Trametes coccinea BRFM310]|uniref:Uncharacterized protein n=1 Tax=Trametes coccinea (strain BRFM310) TaxID=1353009 RepID=A0A1Y2IS53_TRAC3|nr:hypothetical protein PYCCODRAFT_165309 [Trametes coccinea BRFM310]
MAHSAVFSQQTTVLTTASCQRPWSSRKLFKCSDQRLTIGTYCRLQRHHNRLRSARFWLICLLLVGLAGNLSGRCAHSRHV